MAPAGSTASLMLRITRSALSAWDRQPAGKPQRGTWARLPARLPLAAPDSPLRTPHPGLPTPMRPGGRAGAVPEVGGGGVGRDGRGGGGAAALPLPSCSRPPATRASGASASFGGQRALERSAAQRNPSARRAD